MNVEYSNKLKLIIQKFLSEQKPLSEEKIRNICRTLCKAAPSDNTNLCYEIYDGYSELGKSKINNSDKKLILINFNTKDIPLSDMEYRKYNINHSQDYHHYVYDRTNNLIFFENSSYVIQNSVNPETLIDLFEKYSTYLNLLVIYHINDTNTYFISQTPSFEEIFDTNFYISKNIEEGFFYKNIKIPKWLYVKLPEELTMDDYIILQNADVKTEFIRKAGIDKLVSLGNVVDSYENYPENEMWVKSEYKIINMCKVVPPKKIIESWTGKVSYKPLTYAPFLYMKNQTTGVYHLEGIHPRCKSLYDAIKMRYNGLNIRDFKIMDIK